MPTAEKTPKKRTRKFPIRNFARLLEEFLYEIHQIEDPDGPTVRDLQDLVNADLLAYYKS